MLPPYLEVMCADNDVIPCNPFEMVLSSASEGKTAEAIGDLLQFEARGNHPFKRRHRGGTPPAYVSGGGASL